MILNPEQKASRDGVLNMLARLFVPAGGLGTASLFCHLFTSADFDPQTGAITNFVAAPGALGTPVENTSWTASTNGEEGRVYRASSIVNVAADAPAVGATVRGVVLGNDTDPLAGSFYLQFEQPYEIASVGQRVVFNVEAGFKAGEFYIRPVVLPQGM